MENAATPKPFIKGLDLLIDDGIHKLCVTSNATSTNTRNILYFIILTCLLSLISVLNTWHDHNWIQGRIKANLKVLDSICLATKEGFPSFQFGKYYETRLKLEAITGSAANNYMAVRLPILGTAFDINDLSLVSGVTLLFLLVVLRFTVKREASNLKIAFNAIDGRYADHSNAKEFQDTVRSLSAAQGVPEDHLLKEINRIRREHHYNFLCMNEVFNFPPSRADGGNSRHDRSLKSGAAQLVFFLPTVAYSLIMLNDYLSEPLGRATEPLRTDVNSFLMIPLFAMITYLCYKCNKQERFITREYENFFQYDYTLEKPPWSKS